MRTLSPHPLLEWPLSELIEVQGLTKYFGARPAIIDLTFSVPHGQVLGFLGPHGAGKSTTMRILAGCLGATSCTASIVVYAITVTGLTEQRRALIRDLESAPSARWSCRAAACPRSSGRVRAPW